jgi:ribose transport system permease protein
LCISSTWCGPWAIGLIAIDHGVPSFWAAMLALVLALSVGALNGLMIAFVEAPALFVTLATTLAIYGVAYWIAPVYCGVREPCLS